MKGVKSILAVTALSVATLLSGCGENTAARDTAGAMIEAMFKRNTNSPEELAMLQGMPEYSQAIDCLTTHLDQSGWGSDQYEFFMAETNNTGNIQLIDSRKFSEAEQVKHFGALLNSSCL